VRDGDDIAGRLSRTSQIAVRVENRTAFAVMSAPQRPSIPTTKVARPRVVLSLLT
jgi:hypothetical protein